MNQQLVSLFIFIQFVQGYCNGSDNAFLENDIGIQRLFSRGDNRIRLFTFVVELETLYMADPAFLNLFMLEHKRFVFAPDDGIGRSPGTVSIRDTGWGT